MSDLKQTPPVLDACCGSRMFWHDPADGRALFVDHRRERHTLKDASSRGGSRELVIDPDVVADFRDLPFDDDAFALVVFDPPHLTNAGPSGWLAKKYGVLDAETWRDDLRAGFAECFRVLRPEGVLVFKWNEDQVTTGEVLALAEHKPLVLNRFGRRDKSHWIVFMKPAEVPA